MHHVNGGRGPLQDARHAVHGRGSRLEILWDERNYNRASATNAVGIQLPALIVWLAQKPGHAAGERASVTGAAPPARCPRFGHVNLSSKAARMELAARYFRSAGFWRLVAWYARLPRTDRNRKTGGRPTRASDVRWSWTRRPARLQAAGCGLSRGRNPSGGIADRPLLLPGAETDASAARLA